MCPFIMIKMKLTDQDLIYAVSVTNYLPYLYNFMSIGI
jgi:hypothetical protein